MSDAATGDIERDPDALRRGAMAALTVPAVCLGGMVAGLIAGGALFYAGMTGFEAAMAAIDGELTPPDTGLRGWLAFPVYAALVIGAAALAAFAFRATLRGAAPEILAKPMRQAPLTAAFGILVILLYVIATLFADVLAPYGEAQVFERNQLLPGEDPAHWLGTDQIGRDILTRLIYGARNTVGIAFITTLLAFLLGATLGFLAAVLQGWLDQALSRLNDVLMAIPSLIFALLIITIVGQSTINMILVIAVLDATRVFRLARAVGMNIVVMDYIEAAKLRGEGLGHLIF